MVGHSGNINLATFATGPLTAAGSATASFSASDSDSYVTLAVVFH